MSYSILLAVMAIFFGRINVILFKMLDVIDWANQEGRRWVFTDSNAGSRYFNDYCDLASLDKLNWNAINASSWKD